MSYQFSPESNLSGVREPAPAPQAQRAGRFAATRGSSAVRHIYGALCRFVPGLAAHMAYAQLARPPRPALNERHIALRKRARRWRLPVGRNQLAVYEWGKGPTILMVHGWGSHATHMGRMIDPLVDAGFRVVAFDAPAHGKSSGGSTDLVQFANAVSTVGKHVGPLHCVIGHSFGAAMAMYAARDWGVEPGRMVLISSFNHCNWFLQMFAEHVGLTAPVLDRMRQMLSRLYGGRLKWSHMSVLEMARQAGFPMLFVHDEDDQEIPFDHSLAMVTALKDAQFKATSGLGHHRVVRHPEVIKRVVAFASH
ncbi:alpha/beta hydrolase [Polaromonas sp.]|uniref:alpha/beta fold hydrolase n=1 Tax=Polaromonas sp. TaxID=1869339 RepID=UPI0024894AAC|nr:alpha/beta hydrolase [Polaromonas sp.]MDI1338463.1 alpha/beta hydrolase [Polaromonas sp.]